MALLNSCYVLLLMVVGTAVLMETTALPNLNEFDQLETVNSSNVPNYAGMHKPKRVLTMREVHGICIAPNGNFATVSFNKPYRHMCIFDYHGNLLKDIKLPGFSGKISDCVFLSNTILLICDYSEQKIYKFTVQGVFIGVFATGYRYIRMLQYGGYVYVTEDVHSWVIIYNSNGNKIYHFGVGGHGRGMSWDTKGYLYVAMNNIVKVFTWWGKYIRQRHYPYLGHADGIVLDAANNIVIADRRPSKALVFSSTGALIKRFNGLRGCADVDIGIDLTLFIVDNGANKIYMY